MARTLTANNVIAPNMGLERLETKTYVSADADFQFDLKPYIDQGYNRFEFKLQRITQSATEHFKFAFVDASNNYIAGTSYEVGRVSTVVGSGPSHAGLATDPDVIMTAGSGNYTGTDYHLDGRVEINDISSAASQESITFTHWAVFRTTDLTYVTGAGRCKAFQPNTVHGIAFYTPTDSIDGGKITCYGRKRLTKSGSER